MSDDSFSPVDVPPASVEVPSPGVELQTLRDSQDRALHMEGIPMLIALADERGGGKNSAPAGDATDTRHAAVLARIDHYRAVLAPSQRESDMGVIASVLTVAAYEDLDRIIAP